MLKFLFIASLLLSCFSLATSVDEEDKDKCISLGLTSTEKSQFLSEMRPMLIDIQGIVTRMKRIAESARLFSYSHKKHNRPNRLSA